MLPVRTDSIPFTFHLQGFAPVAHSTTPETYERMRFEGSGECSSLQNASVHRLAIADRESERRKKATGAKPCFLFLLNLAQMPAQEVQ